MKTIIKVVAIASLFTLFSSFNSKGLKAEINLLQISQVPEKNTGKVISLNTVDMTGLIKDEITGAVYAFSYNGQDITLSLDDIAAYTVDKANAGRVIVGSVIRR